MPEGFRMAVKLSGSRTDFLETMRENAYNFAVRLMWRGMFMEYITVREAAYKWQVSERLVQQYCTAGRIPGAGKFGGAWAIPADARKPADPRRERKRPVPADAGLSRVPMPLMNAPFVPGHCREYAEGIQDPGPREIALAEYFYFSARPEEAVRITERYLAHPDPALRLSAHLMHAYANLALGRPQQTRYALVELRNALNTPRDTPSQIRATEAFVAAAAAVLLHLPLPEGLPPAQEYLPLLPPGLRIFALYVQAHYAYLQEQYEKSIGIVEATLAMQTEQYPIPLIYLHLVAVMNHMSLRQPEQAQAHLLAAWELARPDDLIEAFGEHHGLLGGMLEAVIKKDWPEDFKRIIAVTYRFSAGWRRVHNPVTGDDVADNLTTTEFAAAMLAARGWTNQEIGEHMNISPNTVKRYLSVAMQKLNIRHRQELKHYMLQ